MLKKFSLNQLDDATAKLFSVYKEIYKKNVAQTSEINTIKYTSHRVGRGGSVNHDKYTLKNNILIENTLKHNEASCKRIKSNLKSQKAAKSIKLNVEQASSEPDEATVNSNLDKNARNNYLETTT